MSRIIDSGLTAGQMFDAVLQAGDFPAYDPDRHLLAKVAADQWGVNVKAALDRLRKLAPEFGLTETRVRLENGHTAIAFTEG